MSSWGWGSKFLNLQAVNDFSIFGSKSSLFFFTSSWEAFFCEKLKKEEPFFFLIFFVNKDLSRPQRDERARKRPIRTNLQNLWGKRRKIWFSKLPYSREFSNFWFQKLTDISYKLMSSWGWGSKLSNLQQVGDFLFLGPKVHFLGEWGA